MGSIKMGIGLGLWQQGMPDAATLFEYTDKADAWGIDSGWLSDHMLGERAEVSLIPMLAAIMARTQRLKCGPSVMMLPLRHPIAVAKDVATLDFLSGGRVIMAVGLGADDKEADFAGNRRRPPEQMLARSAVGTPEACREMRHGYLEPGLTKFALWPARLPSQLLQQLAYYAQDIVPYFEQRAVPVAMP